MKKLKPESDDGYAQLCDYLMTAPIQPKPKARDFLAEIESLKAQIKERDEKIEKLKADSLSQIEFLNEHIMNLERKKDIQDRLIEGYREDF